MAQKPQMNIEISYEKTPDETERLKKLALLLLGKDKDLNLKESKEKRKDGLAV